jgi:hypothetical protein
VREKGGVTVIGYFARLFRRGGAHDAHGKVDCAYVSEHTNFMNDFLQHHPEVVKDQWTGREIYWDKKVDVAEQAKARADEVPDDGYGFYYRAWRGNGKSDSKRTRRVR